MILPIYFWKDEQLHTYQGDSDTDSIRDTQFMDCYVVDPIHATANWRYGKYTKDGWRHVPLDEFPKEFRTHLLLLGII